ncbi:MAG: outer membrane lipoprotein carrier protein LolA [Candidatus Sumerlaeaceae bacterium]|nr:outer membrane lipoprotein carrier protein LolA [Candidatus Sumerlaeaceae bacterium]
MNLASGWGAALILTGAIMIADTGLLPAQQPPASAEAGRAGGGSPRQRTNDPEAVDLLRRLETRYADVRTIQGRFRQIRVDPAFDEKVESQATFFVRKPDNFRVDYAPPRESTNLIADGYSYRYVKDLKQVERYRFQNRKTAQDLNFLLLGFGEKTDEVLRVFAAQVLTEGVPKGMKGIQLTPHNKAEANFEYLTILVTDDERVLPSQFSLGALDGSRTTANLDLQTLGLNVPIAESVFRPNWPRDAQIVDIQ